MPSKLGCLFLCASGSPSKGQERAVHFPTSCLNAKVLEDYKYFFLLSELGGRETEEIKAFERSQPRNEIFKNACFHVYAVDSIISLRGD